MTYKKGDIISYMNLLYFVASDEYISSNFGCKMISMFYMDYADHKGAFALPDRKIKIVTSIFRNEKFNELPPKEIKKET